MTRSDINVRCKPGSARISTYGIRLTKNKQDAYRRRVISDISFKFYLNSLDSSNQLEPDKTLNINLPCH